MSAQPKKITQLDAFRTAEEQQQEELKKIIVSAIKSSFAIYDRLTLAMEKMNETLCTYLEKLEPPKHY